MVSNSDITIFAKVTFITWVESYVVDHDVEFLWLEHSLCDKDYWHTLISTLSFKASYEMQKLRRYITVSEAGIVLQKSVW